MATANENIRDALVKRQIMLVKQSGKASREVLDMLDDAHGDLKERIDKRLRAIADSGQRVQRTRDSRDRKRWRPAAGS